MITTPTPTFPNLRAIEHDLLSIADAIHDAFDRKAEIARLRAINHTQVADILSSTTVAAFAAWLDPERVAP